MDVRMGLVVRSYSAGPLYLTSNDVMDAVKKVAKDQ